MILAQFEPQNFISNLSYMGKGMLGIILVIGIIILVTDGLNKIVNNIANKKK